MDEDWRSETQVASQNPPIAHYFDQRQYREYGAIWNATSFYSGMDALCDLHHYSFTRILNGGSPQCTEPHPQPCRD